MKRHFYSFLFLCLCSFFAQAQDLNGFWKGTLTMTGGCFPINNIELQISISGNIVRCDSYHYLDIYNYIKKECSGTYNADAKSISIQENIVTTYNIPQHCDICIKRYDLVYSKNGNVETLSGGWTGHIINSQVECLPGTIVLSRIKESAFKEIPEIKADTGQIRLDFYDNGVIDGDSITVLVNKQVVLSHQRLTAKPITLYVRIDSTQRFQQVEMVAENLGTIPPNTALLIITAGKKRYQLFLTSTETKSATIRFIYDNDVGTNEQKQ